MTRFLSGNLFLLLSMTCAATAQLLLKGVLQEVDPPGAALSSWRPLLTPDRSLRGGAAGLLIGVGFLCWLMCLARLPLGYAYSVASSSILLVVLLGVVFLGESLTPRILVGAVLIVLGVVLLAPR